MKGIKTTKRAAVAGAGIGGIAAALRLAAKGYKVDVFEAHAQAGGKISEFRTQGFRFDTGPSLFTMPELADALFRLFDENPRKHFVYHQLTESTRYFFDDGTVLNVPAGAEAFAQEVARTIGEDPVHIQRYLEVAEVLYRKTANIFIFSPFKFKTFVSKDARQAGLQLHKLDAFRSLHRANSRSFADKRLVQLFDRYATYNGSNPYKSPATFKIISHLEHNIGAYFPAQGMYEIVSSLRALAERHGVKFYFNTPVKAFHTRKKRVEAIEVNGKRYAYDVYISDIDVFNMYQKHKPGGKLPLKLRMQELSTSAMIFFWGINRAFPGLNLHNILFASNYAQEFKALFSEKTIPEDPTVYIFISKKLVATDAPEGCENWYVMINAPADYGQNWHELRKKARKAIVRKINRSFHTDIEQAILFEKVSDPPEIAHRTGAYKGALYGTSSNSQFSAFLRHANTAKSVKNMYFTGGSVHPGGGIPLCLASAKIAINEITD